MMERDQFVIDLINECLSLGIKPKKEDIEKVIETYIREGLLQEIRKQNRIYIDYTPVGNKLYKAGFFKKKSNLKP